MRELGELETHLCSHPSQVRAGTLPRPPRDREEGGEGGGEIFTSACTDTR